MNIENHPDNDGVPLHRDTGPAYLKTAVIAERYGLSPRTVRSLGARGILPRRVINPNFVLYNVRLCDAIMEKNPEQALTPFAKD